MPRMVGDDGVLRGPAADGRVSVVAQADVAAAAVAVLEIAANPSGPDVRPSPGRPPSPCTRPRSSWASTGRAVRYEPETVEQAYASRASYGAPRWQLDAWVSTYTAIANGELAIVSDAVARLTGRPSMPLAAVLSGIG